MGSVTLAVLLFVAGIIEYVVISAWYDSYSHGQVTKSVILVHIQLLLWLFVLNTLITVMQAVSTPFWVALAYIEGCALAVGVMTWRKRKHKKK